MRRSRLPVGRLLRVRGDTAPTTGGFVLLTVFGFVVALADAVPSLMQTSRTVRTRRAEGLSAFTQAAWTMSWAVWFLHAYVVRDGPLLLAASVGLGTSAVLTFVLARMGRFPHVRPLAAPFLAYTLVAAAMVHHSVHYGALALAVVDIVFFYPQVRLAARASDLSGISVWSYVTEIAMSVAWVAYTVAAGFPAAGLFSAVSAVAFGFVLSKVLADRRR